MSDDAASEEALRCCSRCRAIYRKDVAFCPSDGGEIVLADIDPLIETALGHYTIDELIGEGAMGRVYRVHHSTIPGRVFALKVLIGDLAATQAMRMRFVNEAKSAGRLAHPNIASVVDFGSQAGLFYLVMELVDGRSLSSLIDDGPLDPDRVARLGRGIALGLRHAHELGLVHRDLKPENVIVTPDELPKIVDFGIAVSIEETDTRLTATGIAMGTPAYVAPEQVSGKELDARADQYALGVTLYEALTGGALPFTGDPVAVVTEKVANAAPPIASQMPADRVVPPGLARIVEKMIERRPRNRFEDLGEVIAALDEWLVGRTGTTANVAMRPRRRRLGIVAAAGLTVALAGTALAWKLARSPGSAEPVATAAKVAPPSAAKAPAPIEAKDPAAIAAKAPAATEAKAPAAIDGDAQAPVVVGSAAPTAGDAQAPVVVGSAAPTAGDAQAPVVVGSAAPALDHDAAAVDAGRPVGRPVRRPTRKPKRGAAPVEVAAREPIVVVPPPPPPEKITTAPPPPVAVALQARVLGVDVQGSLSQAVIQRAVDRVRPAIERCTAAGAPHTVAVKFTIDESRRAHGLRSSGAAASASCLVGALGAVRTEAAPDTGDAEVVVRIAFGSHS